MSGKSSIGTLLVEYISNSYVDIEVKLVNLLDWIGSDERKLPTPKKRSTNSKPDPFETWWLKENGETLTVSLTTRSEQKKRFIIIDEAQSLYPLGSNHSFWIQLKNIQGKRETVVYVLLLSMFGDAPSDENIEHWNTPIEFRQVLNLNHILFSKDEYITFISSWNKEYPLLPIGPDTTERLWNATLGHIGFIRLGIEAIRDHFLDQVKMGLVWDDSASAKYLLSKFFYNKLSDCRAVPKGWVFSNDEKVFLDSILLSSESKITRPLQSNKAQKKINRDMIKRGIVFDDGISFVLSAPILKMLLTRQLHGVSERSFTRKQIDEFVIETVKRMRPDQLKNSFSVGKDSYLLERQWQMEFYRAATFVLDVDHFISPDVGSEGWIDFYVDDDFEWGIELLREGYKIGQHASRFENEGVYDSLKLKKAIILDFRRASKEPQLRKYCVPIFYIMYSENFEEVTIKSKGRETITFSLAES
eukprot:TRINITY_DN8560_c0_g1_i4.p1 TRINITY_DN8560_c0_g1~~TRINITY_DN8560_c0_g1_i4.p1  ORF type:complete len:473 (+),score=67.24 TRINITY_DN8560_c0_g1_i4:373-1791(+)